MFEDMKRKSEQVLLLIKGDFQMIKSGRARPTMVEKIMIEAYPGTKLPLVELASITAPDPHLLVIQPWDVSVVRQVAAGLAASDMHLSTVVDGNVIRINIPSLTEDRRKEMVKIVKQKLEGGKEMLRDVRNDAKKHTDEQKGKPGVSEDDIFTWHEEIQKIHDDYCQKLEAMATEKEKELMEI